MLYFNLLSSDIIKEGTDSKYMSFSKLNSNLDSNFLKIYTPHVSMVLLLLMYSCCYGYLCLVKNNENLDVMNLNKIGMHKAFISPKRITVIKVMQSQCP